MLSIGWTEMMLVAAVALIVVGPKDLPAMLRQIGKAVGSVRRMGNEFKAELNKVTAVNELKDIKQSIAAPLTETRRNIEKEFNSIAPNGSVEPTGKIKPNDPDAQSVAQEIKSAAGLKSAPKPKTRATRKSVGVSAKSPAAKKAVAANKPATKKPAVTKKPIKKQIPATKTPATKSNTVKKPVVKTEPVKKLPSKTKATKAKSAIKPAQSKGARTKPGAETATS